MWCETLIVIVFWLVYQNLNWKSCRVQNSAARVVTKSRKIIRVLIINFSLNTQKYVIGACLQYLSDLPNTYKPERNIWSSNQMFLCIPSGKDIWYLLNDMVNAVSNTNHMFCLIKYLMNLDVLTIQLVSKRDWKHIFKNWICTIWTDFVMQDFLQKLIKEWNLIYNIFIRFFAYAPRAFLFEWFCALYR